KSGYSAVSYVFFSSRRRHTRFSRDWSSDVCSSDLVIHGDVRLVIERSQDVAVVSVVVFALDGKNRDAVIAHQRRGHVILRGERRSEERRVGKELRYRGGTVR